MTLPRAGRRCPMAVLFLAGVLAFDARAMTASEFLFKTAGSECPVEARSEWGYTVDVLALQGHRWQVRTQSFPSADSLSPALERILDTVRDLRGRMIYAPDVWSENPAEVLTAARGNCVSYAAVLSARVAALGFRVTTVHGLLFSRTPNSPFYRPEWKATPHRWVSIFVPDRGWVSVDPLSPTAFPTRLHVPLAAPLSIEALKDMRIQVLQWE